ncbi:UNVERIFIED_CONTAM: hypothetical protein Sradi_3356800 [Sesamum radiatum]|uniref:Uncharacterized protein n=1 Tax=Sesamum radiatum TaxID=300843 RepID=A0AAW2R425_SESRA
MIASAMWVQFMAITQIPVVAPVSVNSPGLTRRLLQCGKRAPCGWLSAVSDNFHPIATLVYQH